MCGRFALFSEPLSIKNTFQTANIIHYPSRYNVAPNTEVVAIRIIEGLRTVSLLHWGFIPRWSKEGNLGHKPINARAETVDTTPLFRAAFKHRRCLIIVDGFYEWQALAGKSKKPYYMSSIDNKPFALAGIWEAFKLSEDKIIESCAIIVAKSNKELSPIHERMPVILLPEYYDEWLNPDNQNTAALKELLHPCPFDKFELYPVSSLVNNPRNDTPLCIQKMA